MGVSEGETGEGRWEKNNEETQTDENDFTRESMRTFKEQIYTFGKTHSEH